MSKRIDDLNRSGVYLLLGTTETDEEAVYIGKADVRKTEKGILRRIHEPHKSIDYWTESIIFTTVDNSLGATELNYLEYCLHEITLEADCCKMTNVGEPHKGILPDQKEDEMEDFIDSIYLVVNAFGRRVLEPVMTKQSEYVEEVPVFYSKGQKAAASGKPTDDGFVVLKGGRLPKKMTSSALK